MAEPEPDLFASLITANCNTTSSQDSCLRSAPLVHQLDGFPGGPDPEYHIPVESNCILMESLSQDEFLTPQEDSLPAASSSDGESAPPIKFLWDFSGSALNGAVDLAKDSDSLGLVVGKSTEEKKSGYTVAEKVRGEVSIGTIVIDSDEDQLFDKMPVRNKEVKMGGSNASVEVADSDVFVGEQGSQMGLKESEDTEIVDLDEDDDLVVGEQELETGEDCTQVMDFDADNKVVELGADADNKEVELGADENIDTEIVDLNENETENTHTEVADMDEDELCNNVTMRNVTDEVDLNEDNELRRKFANKGIHVIDKFKQVTEKGISSGEKGPDLRKLPSSLCIGADATLHKGDDHNKETKNGPVEEKANESGKSKCVGETSSGSGGFCDLPSPISEQKKKDQIMKNLLDALDLISGGEKEKGNDDVAGEDLDFWDTIMLRGLKYPHPKWWPLQEPDD